MSLHNGYYATSIFFALFDMNSGTFCHYRLSDELSTCYILIIADLIPDTLDAALWAAMMPDEVVLCLQLLRCSCSRAVSLPWSVSSARDANLTAAANAGSFMRSTKRRCSVIAVCCVDDSPAPSSQLSAVTLPLKCPD